MNKILKFILTCTVLLGSLTVFADELNEASGNHKLLVINPLSSDLQLTDVEKRLINKITIKVCAKQKGFHIALGEIGIAKNANFGIYNLQLTLKETTQGIEVSTLLLDEIKKQVLGKVNEERVLRLHLMRSIEDSLDKVFSHQKK